MLMLTSAYYANRHGGCVEYVLYYIIYHSQNLDGNCVCVWGGVQEKWVREGKSAHKGSKIVTLKRRKRGEKHKSIKISLKNKNDVIPQKHSKWARQGCVWREAAQCT